MLSVVTTQLCPWPAATRFSVFPDSTPVVVTATGVVASVVVPSPSRPFELLPQQYVWLFAVAQVWLYPVLMSVVVPAGRVVVVTAVGAFWLLVVPFPSRPFNP